VKEIQRVQDWGEVSFDPVYILGVNKEHLSIFSNALTDLGVNVETGSLYTLCNGNYSIDLDSLLSKV
jgi:hypothetical protein